jgi:hypothetical protein
MLSIYSNNDLREKILPKNPDKSHLLEYKFCFNDLGSWRDVHVSDKLPIKITHNKIKLLSYHKQDQPVDLLLVFLEKAAAK